MAHIQATFMSKTLFRNVTIQVILPVDKFSLWGDVKSPDKPFKTLYLLHGIFGNCNDWINGTALQRWAEEKNLCVVMPSGENSFYVDQPGMGNNFGMFIGEELVEITRKMFPLSHKRGDTFIGGLSMGGFGAVRNGLKYSETFGRIASLSGALHILEEDRKRRPLVSWESGCFGGDMNKARASDMNPRVLIKEFEEGKKNSAKPEIFMVCGTEDPLLKANRTFREAFEKAGFAVTYGEAPGKHDWDFWNEHIREVIDWLPLDEKSSGTNSGNVL